MAKRVALTSLENDLEPCPTPPSTCYQWYSSTDLLEERQRKTEERRRQILEAAEKDQYVSVSEWLALLYERDQLLRLSIEKENESYKKEFVRDLRRVLNNIPTFSSSREDQKILNSVINLKEQLNDYSKENEIPSPTPYKPYLSIQPRVDFIPTDLHGQFQSVLEGFTSQRKETVSLPPPYSPLPFMNPSSIKPIPQDSKEVQTEVHPRLPGGTPKCPKNSALVNVERDGCHCDIPQRPLSEKFKNVQIHSTPNKSSNNENELFNTSSEIGGEDCWGVFNPDLTHIPTDTAISDIDAVKDLRFSLPSVTSQNLPLSSLTQYSSYINVTFDLPHETSAHL